MQKLCSSFLFYKKTLPHFSLFLYAMSYKTSAAFPFQLELEHQENRQQQRKQERLKETLAAQKASTSEVEKLNKFRVSFLKSIKGNLQ